MQVKMGEREKKIVKLGILLFRKKLGKRGKAETIHEELSSIDYPPIKKLVTLINKVGNGTNHKYQALTIKEYGELGIWLVINHPSFDGIFESICRNATNMDIPDEKFQYKSKLTKTEIWLMNKVLIYIKNKLLEPGGLYHYIQQDIEVTQNEACKYIIPIVKKGLDPIDNEELFISISILFDIFVWCMIRDTAYRDQFFWALWQVGNKEIRQRIKEHPTNLVRPPKKWYCNLWVRGGEESKKQRASGKLMLGEFSTLESPCVPHIQNKEVKKGFKG